LFHRLAWRIRLGYHGIDTAIANNCKTNDAVKSLYRLEIIRKKSNRCQTEKGFITCFLNKQLFQNPMPASGENLQAGIGIETSARYKQITAYCHCIEI
jgi:hypothetical protein